jgi:NADH/F420H2 dehydrogenase subunit C
MKKVFLEKEREMTIQPFQEKRAIKPQDSQTRQAQLMRELASLEHITGQKPAMHIIKGNVLNLDVEREHLLSVCRFLRDQLGFNLLSSLSGVDMVDHLEVIYHLRSLPRKQLLQFRVRLDAQKPELESVVSIWLGANWLEREVYEMFGIHFRGHPDLRRILLDDDFEGYPLLKSFQAMPPVVKDQATTQVNPNMAIAQEFQTRNYEIGTPTKVGQGRQERLYPGTPTFGSTQRQSPEPANPFNGKHEEGQEPGSEAKGS